MRNGPDQRHAPLFPEGRHWFDGDGMIHWCHLSAGDGAQSYGCSYVETQGFKEEREKGGEALYCGIKQSPILDLVLHGMWSKVRNFPTPDRPWWVIQTKNTANNGLLVTGKGTLLATYEAGSPYEIRFERSGGGGADSSTLRLVTEGVYTPTQRDAPVHPILGAYNHYLHNFTAHAKVCPRTNEVIFLSYDLIGQRFSVGVLDSDDSLVSMETFEFPFAEGEACMMHDFAITEGKVVLMAHPLLFDKEQSMGGGVPFTYDMSAPSFFGILDRRRGGSGGLGTEAEVSWVEADNCYCFHSMACWEEGETVHLYAHRLDVTGALGMATFRRDGNEERPLVEEKARLHKWTLQTAGRGEARGKVVESREVGAERIYSDFPEINPEYTGRPVRYGYSLRISEGKSAGDGVPLFDRVMKMNLEEETVEASWESEGKVMDDMTFVPDPNRQEEDGGWLLFFSHQLEASKSFLEILDASTLTLQCTVELPRIPLGFHATFVPVEVVKTMIG